MKVRELACQYLKLTPEALDSVIDTRQNLMNMERNMYSDNFGFYQNSKFLMASHIKDEEERDADTDWADMVNNLKQHNLTEFDNVLDFGCGIGSAGLNLKARVPINALYCYEPNHDSHYFIQHRIHAGQLQNIHTYWDKEVCYDLVIAWGVFEHLEDDEACILLNGLIRQLTDKGMLFLKNFYSDTDDYRFHFGKGKRIAQLFENYKDKIIYAKHSDI